MNPLLHYLLESGACLLVFYLLYVLALKREKCFTYNRFYLLLTPFLAFLLPLLEITFLPQPEPLTVFISEQLTPIAAQKAPAIKESTPFIVTHNAAYPVAEEPVFDFTFFLVFLYGAGVLFFVIRLGRELYRLHQFKRQTLGTRFYWQHIPVHKTNGLQPTFSFGNCIFWDNSQVLHATETEQIFMHEAVHVRQKHTWDILYLEFFKILFWFNPLFYFYQKFLARTHEFIADAAVLRTNSETYSHLLVKQVLHRLNFSFGNYFNKSLVLIRLKMLKQTPRSHFWKQVLALPVLGTLLFFLSSGNSPLAEVVKNQVYLVDALPVVKAGSSSIQPKFSEPLFPGGKKAMYRFFAQNLKYPAEGMNAIGSAVGMSVVIEIDEKGILKIPEYTNRQENPLPTISPIPIDKEVHRVLTAMPTQWVPAMVNDRPVASRYIFCFDFFKVNPAEKITERTEKESYEIDSDNKPVVISRPIYTILYDPNIPVEPRRDQPIISYYNPRTTIQTAAATSGSAQTVSSLTYDNKIQFPLFPGGRRKMYEYFHQNVQFDKYIHYIGNNIAGAFTMAEIKIDETGKVAPATSNIDDALAQEINEAIRRMPVWQPAEVDGKPTAATYNLTLAFKKDVNIYEEGRVTENLEKYTGGELKINAVLFGKKAYVAENNPNEPVLTVVEKKPEFPGGMEKMYDFVNKNLQYPPAARAAKLEGMVIAKFIVTRDGRILETRVENHLSPETDVEILRVIQKMPRWTPGKQNGEAVNAEYTLPFKFRLNNKPLKSKINSGYLK